MKSRNPAVESRTGRFTHLYTVVVGVSTFSLMILCLNLLCCKQHLQVLQSTISTDNSALYIQGRPKKPDHFWKCITSVYDNVGRHSMFSSLSGVRLIFWMSPYKYSLHKIRETIPHRKDQLIQAIKTAPFLTVCNSCKWWCREVIHTPNCSVFHLQ